MRRNLKKVLTSLLALAMMLGGMVGFNMPVRAEGETVAYLSFADDAWANQYWNDGNDYSPIVVETAEVTGYGQYTVSADLTGTANGFGSTLAFLDVEISNGETSYPNSFMTIDSVKINGEEVTLGKTYTSSDDQIATRTNLFNGWVSEITAGRTADGDATDVTATPVDVTAYPEVKTIEVTFTLGDGVEAFAAETEAVAAELPAEGTPTYISMADNSWSVQYWNDGNDYSPIVANTAMVTGYGQYTTSLDFSGVEGGCPDIVFMDVEIAGGETYFPNCYMQIDSIKINGEEIEFGNTYTSSDDGIATRTNLFNSWVAEVAEGRTAEGLTLADVTATPVDATLYTAIQTVEVTFTLMEGAAVVAEEEAAPGVDLNGVYHAYFGIQTPAWSFRNAWNDATYGKETEFFNTITGWDGSDPISKGGTFTDVEIAGNGTYSVSMTGDFDIAGDFADQDFFNLIFASTDIPLSDEIKITDVNVIMDGKTVYTFADAFLNPDSTEYIDIQCANLWNADLANGELFYYAIPTTSVEIQFTVSGFAYDNASMTVEEPAVEEEVAAPVEESTGLSTGMIVVIVVVVVAIVAGVVVLVAKKKK